METESFGQKAKRKTFKFLKLVAVAIFIVLVAWFCFAYFAVYEDGIRAGIVLKLSKKGVLFKTYEGQLNLETFGSLKNASPIAGTFDFSVESGNEKTIQDLDAVALSGERVNLKYVKRYVAFPWRGDTKYFVQEVERLGPPKGN
jgi:hypothetical protein